MLVQKKYLQGCISSDFMIFVRCYFTQLEYLLWWFAIWIFFFFLGIMSNGLYIIYFNRCSQVVVVYMDKLGSGLGCASLVKERMVQLCD